MIFTNPNFTLFNINAIGSANTITLGKATPLGSSTTVRPYSLLGLYNGTTFTGNMNPYYYTWYNDYIGLNATKTTGGYGFAILTVPNDTGVSNYAVTITIQAISGITIWSNDGLDESEHKYIQSNNGTWEVFSRTFILSGSTNTITVRVDNARSAFITRVTRQSYALDIVGSAYTDIIDLGDRYRSLNIKWTGSVYTNTSVDVIAMVIRDKFYRGYLSLSNGVTYNYPDTFDAIRLFVDMRGLLDVNTLHAPILTLNSITVTADIPLNIEDQKGRIITKAELGIFHKKASYLMRDISYNEWHMGEESWRIDDSLNDNVISILDINKVISLVNQISFHHELDYIPLVEGHSTIDGGLIDTIHARLILLQDLSGS